MPEGEPFPGFDSKFPIEDPQNQSQVPEWNEPLETGGQSSGSPGASEGGGHSDAQDEGLKRVLVDVRTMDENGGETEYSWKRIWVNMLPEEDGEAVEGGSTPHPWYLSVAYNDPNWQWQVAAFGSSINDGINGDDVMDGAELDVETTITAEKYIVAEADVDSNLVVTDWVLSAVDLADAVEVEFNGATPPLQTKVRILIGKIVVSYDEEEPPNITGMEAIQAVFTPQELTYVFLNGKIVRGVVAAATNPESL